MERILAWWQRLPAIAVDILAVSAGLADTWVGMSEATPHALALNIVACVALLARRKFPLAVFLATLPATFVSATLVAPMIALFTLSRHRRNRWLLAGCAALFAAVSAFAPLLAAYWQAGAFDGIVAFIYQLAAAAAPLFLGQLALARQDLRRQLEETEAATEHERILYAETVLARERAQLAREMHDVVAHQVSLIAVQAAAIQVTAKTQATAASARAIRQLSVRTLEELRTMVTLLRVAGATGPGLAPQPTIADLPHLLGTSALDVDLSGTLPADLPAGIQRALYRTVQEALTNARKHAPGSRVSVDLWSTPGQVGVIVRNTAPTHPPMQLPSSRLGLLGLSERAELLGGTLQTDASAAGGYEVRMALPVPDS